MHISDNCNWLRVSWNGAQVLEMKNNEGVRFWEGEKETNRDRENIENKKG